MEERRRSPRLACEEPEFELRPGEPVGVARARTIPEHAIQGVTQGGCGGRGQGRGRGGRGSGGGRGGRGGRGGGGSGPRFSPDEIDHLLILLERLLPIGPNEWSTVATEQQNRFPDKDRTELSLRRQFTKLYKKPAPTGNPNIPLVVLEAKRIQRLIEQRADAAGMDEPGDLGFAEDAPPDNPAANAFPRQAVARAPAAGNVQNGGTGINNVRPVVNIGGRGLNPNGQLQDIMQMMIMRSEEERADRTARALVEAAERRDRQEERDRWMQQMAAMQQQSQLLMMKFMEKGNLKKGDDDEDD